MSINQKNILVTGARAPATLHLCRILNDDGMNVFSSDSVPYAVTKASNSIKGFYVYPSPKKETKEFISTLVKIIQSEKIDILIPTCEESFYISMHKGLLEQYCQVIVGDFSSMKLLHNKYEFIEYVSHLCIRAPKTLKLTKSIQYEDIVEQFENDVVLKKIYSRFSDNVLFVNKFEIFSLPIEKDSSWLVQEKVAGEQYCSYGIAINGKLIAHSVYKTEFTAGLGATIAFEYHERRDIEQIVRTIVEKLNFSGQISFDFIVDKNNVAYPIECNPRTTSGLHLFDKSLSSIFTGEENSQTLYPNPSTREAIKLALLFFLIDNIKRNHNIKKLFEIIITYKDITFRKNDLKPFFYQFKSMYSLWKESRKNNLTMSEQSTADICWDGE